MVALELAKRVAKQLAKLLAARWAEHKFMSSLGQLQSG